MKFVIFWPLVRAGLALSQLGRMFAVDDVEFSRLFCVNKAESLCWRLLLCMAISHLRVWSGIVSDIITVLLNNFTITNADIVTNIIPVLLL